MRLSKGSSYTHQREFKPGPVWTRLFCFSAAQSLAGLDAGRRAPSAERRALIATLPAACRIGDLADNDSWSALAGQTLMGLVPVAGQIADARDTLYALNEVADAEPGAWLKLAAAGIGWIPGIGDALKGGARVAKRLGAEAVEEVC